jgi:hypothetical protein
MKATPLLSFFIPVILISCGILAVSDPDEIEFHPSGENTILSSTDTISVSFPFTLNHAPVEALFQVKDFGGTVPGRFLWEGSSCRFQPEPSLTPGSRYVFSFNGTVQDTKGQAHTVHHIAPFFYMYRADQAPHITSISPSRGQVVSTHKVVEERLTGIWILFLLKRDQDKSGTPLRLSMDLWYKTGTDYSPERMGRPDALYSFLPGTDNGSFRYAPGLHFGHHLSCTGGHGLPLRCFC